ncbi:MAG: hypothetical protein JWQ01_4976 [Massilia sp.]|nr:hypothetical protein [Massilia sp.]
MVRIPGIHQRSVAQGAAAILRRTRALAGNAPRISHAALRHGELFDADVVHPIIPEVVPVLKPSADGRDHPERKALFISDVGIDLVVIDCPEPELSDAELVKVRIGPADCYLENLVKLTEDRIGSYLEPPPDQRLDPRDRDL